MYKPPFYKQIYHQLRRKAARIWLRNKSASKICVTGSQGKTHTSLLIASILKKNGSVIVTDKNLDTEFNVPITALKVRHNTKCSVFEMGIDGFGQMDNYLEIVNPDIAVVTGICAVHTDENHLGRLENVVSEKGKLVEALGGSGLAVLNYDDENTINMRDLTSAKVITFGRNSGADLSFSDPVVTAGGLNFTLNVSDRVILMNRESTDSGSELSESKNHSIKQGKNKKAIKVKSKLVGCHQMYNIAAAYAVTSALGVSDEDFLDAVAEFRPLKGRLSIEKGPRGTLVLNDGLRANPHSTKAGLQALADIDHKGGRKIAVLNEMGELANSEVEHREIGKFVGDLGIDLLLCVGPLQKHVADEAIRAGMSDKCVVWVENVLKAADYLKNYLEKNDFLYIKGSLLRHSERILLSLSGEGVTCDLTSCDFYHQCNECSKLSQ